MPDVHYTIENVHESLEDIVSPAFYVTTPIDAYDENSIYLNMGSDGAVICGPPLRTKESPDICISSPTT